MLSPGQFAKLNPVVASAWAHHCAQRGFDPQKKKANGYRDWYEDVLVKSVGVNSTASIRTASEFGKALLAFAEIAQDERLARDLAQDEENRNRWVLRMLVVDLSFLRCDEITWEYVRGIYGQSKLPPGDFDDCPAALLLKVIAMLDVQIQRECKHYGISKHHLPRRASKRQQPQMLDVLNTVASANGYTVPDLVAWHDKMARDADAEMKRLRNIAAHPQTPDPAHASTTTDTTTTQGDCPF